LSAAESPRISPGLHDWKRIEEIIFRTTSSCAGESGLSSPVYMAIPNSMPSAKKKAPPCSPWFWMNGSGSNGIGESSRMSGFLVLWATVRTTWPGEATGPSRHDVAVTPGVGVEISQVGTLATAPLVNQAPLMMVSPTSSPIGPDVHPSGTSMVQPSGSV